MGRLIKLMILCAFVALTHLMPRLRKYSAAASWRLPSPLANLFYWRILSAFVASTHLILIPC